MSKFDLDPPPGKSLHPPFQRLLDEVGAFIYTTDRDGCYTYANRMVLELLGHRLGDILGKNIGQFFDLEDDDSLYETDRRVLQGETVACEESNLIRATGELRTYWSVKEPLRDPDGTIIGMLGISYDITEKKRLEDKVLEQKKLLDTVLDNVGALVYMKDANRRFVYVNKSVADVFGQSVERITGSLDTDFLPHDLAEKFREQDRQILESGHRQTSEETLFDAAGRRHHYWSVVVPWTGPDGTPAVIGFSTDITELHELKEELQRQARTDSLTGIANRRTFYERAELEFARSRRHDGTPLSLIVIDIDRFKQINDGYGHPVGDQVLRNFAQCCGADLRSEDLIARTGGEEFCILLPDTDLDAAYVLAERIRKKMRRCTVNPEYPSMRVSASFGVASQTSEDPQFETLYSRADRALYVAKQEGRDRVVSTPVEATD